MHKTNKELSFRQIHIEVARNATDDFNPFHDKHRWQNVAGNPFGGPIALGFQLECLIAQEMRRYRRDHNEGELLRNEKLRYSSYEFRFVNAVKPQQDITIDIKNSRFKTGDNPMLANRVSLLADGKLAVTGYKRDSLQTLYLEDPDLTALGDFEKARDRSYLDDKRTFLKRKYLTTSNAKNFLSGSLVEQADYIDELAEKVLFPEIFPCALLSSALLERAWQEGHDFEKEPMVYKSHSICIDRQLQNTLHSNDALHLLSRPTQGSTKNTSYECFGIVGSDNLLFRARIDLMPLLEEQSS